MTNQKRRHIFHTRKALPDGPHLHRAQWLTERKMRGNEPECASAETELQDRGPARIVAGQVQKMAAQRIETTCVQNNRAKKAVTEVPPAKRGVVMRRREPSFRFDSFQIEKCAVGRFFRIRFRQDNEVNRHFAYRLEQDFRRPNRIDDPVTPHATVDVPGNAFDSVHVVHRKIISAKISRP